MVHEVPGLRGLHAGADEDRHVLEEGLEIDLLLVVGPQRHPLLLPHDGEHRLVIQLGVVQPVQEVDGSGTRRRDAYADVVRELGVSAGHERGHLLVAGLDELRALRFGAIERTEEAVDAVSGVSEHAVHAPFTEAFEDEITDQLAHPSPPSTVGKTYAGARIKGRRPGLCSGHTLPEGDPNQSDRRGRDVARTAAMIRQRCPRCLQGRVYRGVVSMNEVCPYCGYVFGREGGYFTGAMYVSYGSGLVVVCAIIRILW